MTFQLHWQNPTEPAQTVFVAETEATEPEDLPRVLREFADIALRRQSECPHGWVPMIAAEGDQPSCPK